MTQFFFSHFSLVTWILSPHHSEKINNTQSVRSHLLKIDWITFAFFIPTSREAQNSSHNNLHNCVQFFPGSECQKRPFSSVGKMHFYLREKKVEGKTPKMKPQKGSLRGEQNGIGMCQSIIITIPQAHMQPFPSGIIFYNVVTWGIHRGDLHLLECRASSSGERNVGQWKIEYFLHGSIEYWVCFSGEKPQKKVKAKINLIYFNKIMNYSRLKKTFKNRMLSNNGHRLK